MNDMMADMYSPCLLENGFFPDYCNERCCREGLCFSVLPEKGQGHFWVYCHDNQFSISIQNFVLYEDLHIEYQQPQYVSINYYDSVSGEELKPFKRLSCNCIKGHLGCDNLYQAVYHKNIPICSTGIVIMPEYYEDYLNAKYPGEYEDPRSAFISVDGSTDFPELVFLFRQIRNFRGTGLSAKLYYEGKVAEAVSLIIEKTSQRTFSCPMKRLSAQDLDSLASVAAYIDDHFAFDIRLDQLARIACMGTTKLKCTFKELHKCTITDYIQNRRMCQAENLLTNTDLNINQIAQIVGYANSSRFSELFRKNIGMLPNEYRKLAVSK
ncbi:helix-turn-helix domain-containing protein [Paenibacillus apiarius]|uniref:AraC family transcriptional regulator n=1 Tax=Paenibacillus apiarius TaxID=46240 RepID=A0ABT4DZ75_9BACL|nr:AraC family transcriptional regulator [Paenibacillus apiarius]MCY9514839.1 AraC family transcriptional regulator [Paenibacillus apiarius]MCY9521281.1 AraC family transcriptional regulator [Paenibacillus apiarius]MCY9560371.1 AraC family transcriptional regulator [Paenibacillus apiarius]MCY9682291.1 AraC family transcriptional regulator [Paenibacillus apiarius]MCY9724034.1 AraC family transcriptional regulator [Paenibacillus apiarius]